MNETIIKLRKDLVKAANTLSKREIRFLVDYYYQVQDYRKMNANQIRALDESKEPHELLSTLFDQSRYLENQIKTALDKYTLSDPIGSWTRSICGIGPVIAAGLIAHIDIEQAPTVGHIWNYAGYNPTIRWISNKEGSQIIDTLIADYTEKGIECQNTYTTNDKNKKKKRYTNSFYLDLERVCGRTFKWTYEESTKQDLLSVMTKRPWNSSFKTLCWKASDCFVKNANRENDFYGSIYHSRKVYESERNEKLEYKDQADEKLKIVGKSTEAYKYYKEGKLPPGHIHARCMRYCVKMFLSHLHHVMYKYTFKKEPPNPFVIEHLGHTHYIAPPNLHLIF